MKENLSLLVLGAYAIALFLGGLVCKEIRDYRDRRKQSSLPFKRDRRQNEERRQKNSELVSAARS
jgi:hypothetical protein